MNYPLATRLQLAWMKIRVRFWNRRLRRIARAQANAGQIARVAHPINPEIIEPAPVNPLSVITESAPLPAPPHAVAKPARQLSPGAGQRHDQSRRDLLDLIRQYQAAGRFVPVHLAELYYRYRMQAAAAIIARASGEPMDCFLVDLDDRFARRQIASLLRTPPARKELDAD